MVHSLVIVESPAKCKKIECYLGSGYKVIASFGHLRNIEGLEAIDISNNFQTTYSIIQEKLKLKQIEKIRSEIANADEVILALDGDREGEAIAWHICDLFDLPVKTTKRIIFNEITENALKIAIKSPKNVDMNLVNAQQARQILDMLVGFTISPILWKCVSRKHEGSLSAGRCQTPALRLVYENYLDIKQCPGKPFYNTYGYFTNMNLLFELNKQFETKDDVKKFLNECINYEFCCTVTEPKKTIKKSPDPLTTSTLQQLASNELHLSPKMTMRYAQDLYENGYITYMRTDCKKYSKDFVDKVKEYISSNYEERYINPNMDGLINVKVDKKEEKNLNKKKTTKEATKVDAPPPQEAHEAIRPVNIHILPLDLTNNEEKIDPKAIKLYEVLWKRTLESCMSSAQYNSITAKIGAPCETIFSYKTEQVVFPGWQIVENKYDKTNKEYNYLLNFKQDTEVKPKKIESKFVIGELKTHYTEARLVQLLEEKGIGRPSTFASLIDKIQERGYVEKQNVKGQEIECCDIYLNDNDIINENIVKREFGNEKNKLVIQPLGIIVIEFLLSNFKDFFNYEYTKLMEDELDLIASGEKKWTSLCKSCNDDLNKVTHDLKDAKKLSFQIDDQHSLIIGKYGPVIKCVAPNDSKNVKFLKVRKDLDIKQLENNLNIQLADIIDPSENMGSIGKYRGVDLFIKKGKYGLYAQWGQEKVALKEFGNRPIDNITYLEVLKVLDRDTVLDPTKPVGLVRELTPNLNIRSGKYGDYIFYKKPRSKNPQFLKLNGFNDDYKKCNKELILNWIRQTYNINI
jgi:DNA topoisomerase-1